MTNSEKRITRLEEAQRLRHGDGHFVSIVHVPPEIPDEDWRTWLAAQPCACGLVGCPERTVGLLIPTPCATIEEWEARYHREHAVTHER
jgi:hypothetical protein